MVNILDAGMFLEIGYGSSANDYTTTPFFGLYGIYRPSLPG
jgi:hypothetical protein